MFELSPKSSSVENLPFSLFHCTTIASHLSDNSPEANGTDCLNPFEPIVCIVSGGWKFR